MKIALDTTIEELMSLLGNSQNILEEHEGLHDPIIQFNLFSDGSFEITEGYYKASATCNSSLNINNEFTSELISKNIIFRLNEVNK